MRTTVRLLLGLARLPQHILIRFRDMLPLPLTVAGRITLLAFLAILGASVSALMIRGVPGDSQVSTIYTPTLTPAAHIRPTPTPPAPTPQPPTREPSVSITHPQDGDSVPLELAIEGEYSDVPPGRLYVILKPIPSDPNQSWWVQGAATLDVDAGWRATAFVGLESDLPGTPFTICAVVTDEALTVGRYGGELPPALARDCISVTR